CRCVLHAAAPTLIDTLPLHDALPIWPRPVTAQGGSANPLPALYAALGNRRALAYSLAYAAHMWELHGFRAWLVAYLVFASTGARSEEHTSELQSRENLVCRLLLEKKK